MITRGIGTVAKGMQALIDFEDVTAHNLANVTTNGYKKTTMTFQDVMQSRVQAQNAQGKKIEIGSLSNGARTERTYIDFSQGGLAESGNKMDVAFQGDGFFKVRYQDIPDNKEYDIRDYYYQRTGNFKLNDENYLVNSDGDFIMDMENRKIRITRDPDAVDLDDMNRWDVMKDLVIAENGQISLVNPNYNVALQKIQICDFEDKTKISGIGQAKYLPIYGQNPNVYTKADGTFSLQQGMVEMSNANTINEMLNSINVSRGYESMSKILKNQSDTVQQAISLGNISR
ncbi:MAG: flagellar hook-basal body complex protein [Candidatus Gastranaerophilales bacterium]|nr:flagellar hook-basal body complex protein [Candidatus Gastranaerophilales bacterium]